MPRPHVTPHSRADAPVGRRPVPWLGAALVLAILAVLSYGGAALFPGGIAQAGFQDAIPAATADAGYSKEGTVEGDSKKGRSAKGRSVKGKPIKEYEIKAALLLNFLKYASIPESSFSSKKAPIVILVVGKDPFGNLLDKAFAKKTLHGRKIVIKRSTAVPKSLDAHLVFAGRLKAKDRKKLIKLSRKKPSILVGEEPGFAAAGGFINMYIKDGKVKFEVNPDRQTDTKIKLKAELLKLALIVHSSKSSGTTGQ